MKWERKKMAESTKILAHRLTYKTALDEKPEVVEDPHWSCGRNQYSVLFFLWLCFLRLVRTWKESGALITTQSIHNPNTHHALVISREPKSIMGRSTNLSTSEHSSPRWQRRPADHRTHFLWFWANRSHSPASLASNSGSMTEFQPREWRWKWWNYFPACPSETSMSPHYSATMEGTHQGIAPRGQTLGLWSTAWRRVITQTNTLILVTEKVLSFIPC